MEQVRHGRGPDRAGSQGAAVEPGHRYGRHGRELLLGDRHREIAHGPYRTGGPYRWPGTVADSHQCIDGASTALRTGIWRPGPDVVEAARVMLPSLQAPPDAPEFVGLGTAWMQRLVRLVHLADTLRTVAVHHRDRAGLDSHPRHPYGSSLATVPVAVDDARDAAHDLELLWARRSETADVDAWESTRIPSALRTHIEALEQVVSGFGDLTADVVHASTAAG